MTNKLPVVGQRYRATDSNKFIHNKNFVLTCDGVSDYMIILNKKEDASCIGWPAKDFFDDFEELPEDKFETKPETQSHISELSPEVKEAMHSVRILFTEGLLGQEYFEVIKSRTAKLVDALDKQFNKTLNEETLKSFSDYEKGVGLKECNSIEELFEDLEEESIWKPVSELPEKSCNVYLRWIDGDILPAEFIAAGFVRDAIFRNSNTEFPYKTTDSRIKEYCTLTDFINNIEKRLRKLEGK